MLNDADSYQGGSSAGEEVTDADTQFSKLKPQVKTDRNSKGQLNCCKEDPEDFDFEAGERLNETDEAILTDATRPIVIFNRTGTTAMVVKRELERGD